MVNNVNAVFYATSYHPIQAGSIDGTDITAHDNGVYRALLASATGLYDPRGDPKAEGDPYCSLFVGRLSAQTDEKSLHEVMSKFGRVKNLRLVRHIVTGASCGYAFVEFETEKDTRHAYEGAHLFKLNGTSILVDYNRQQLMAGWIPRRLGGGLGGKKESGQLRFGGRDRPFRAPLRPIPHEELQKLGIPLPPEGRYMNRFQVPPPPQRKRTADDGRSNLSESKHRRVHAIEEDDSNDQTFFEAHGSEAGEERERDRHRRRRDEVRDRVDGDYHRKSESRSYYRKHEEEDQGQESRRESRYEGFEFEPKRQTSRDGQDVDDTRGGERVERKRRREHSFAHRDYEDEDMTRHGRWLLQDDSEQSRGSRDAELGDAHDRHRESRHRSEDRRQSSRESERKHRHSDSKHRRRDEDEDKPHRSSRKYKHHRDRSAGEDLDAEEKDKKRSKHRERDV